jgi:hypothetical protein
MPKNITPKENYLRLARGEMPEYITNFTMGGMWPPTGTPTIRHAEAMAGPTIFFVFPQPDENGNRPNEWRDLWGVPYVANAETGFAGLPKPGEFILEDVTKWDKVIKRPEHVRPADDYDWEAMAKEGTGHIDRETTAVMTMVGDGPFQFLMGAMGFTEGLIALSEEPEAVEELFNFLGDFYEPYIAKIMDAYKPDLLYLGDDTASKYAPFFSVQTFKRLFKPVYARYGKIAKERGIPIQFHNCGKAEAFIEDYIDIGVKYWDPAQTTNDLVGIKEKYKGQFNIVGGFDFVPDLRYNQVTEDEVRAKVRETIDTLAPGGGYAFLGGYLGRADELDIAAQINTWINDEVDTYGYTFYDK